MREAGDLLVCKGVTKQFGSLVAVKDLGFTARRGEILGIGVGDQTIPVARGPVGTKI